VSKNSYPYPPDEFDSVNPTSRPQEVHAARRSAWSRVWPFIVVIIAVPAIAFAVIKVLSSWDSAQDAAPGGSTITSTTTATVTDPPTPPPAAETAPPAGEATDGDAGAEDPSDGTGGDDAPPPIDRSVAVKVLNAKGEQGVAGRASDLLRQDGWTSVSADNYEGEQIEGASTVYYGKNIWSTSAQSVAGILQIDLVEKDTDGSPDGITIVLRQDFIL
jgi:hypothetical protein